MAEESWCFSTFVSIFSHPLKYIYALLVLQPENSGVKQTQSLPRENKSRFWCGEMVHFLVFVIKTQIKCMVSLQDLTPLDLCWEIIQFWRAVEGNLLSYCLHVQQHILKTYTGKLRTHQKHKADSEKAWLLPGHSEVLCLPSSSICPHKSCQHEQWAIIITPSIRTAHQRPIETQTWMSFLSNELLLCKIWDPDRQLCMINHNLLLSSGFGESLWRRETVHMSPAEESLLSCRLDGNSH